MALDMSPGCNCCTPPVPTPCGGSITVVAYDCDGNPLAGATVELLPAIGSGNTPISTKTTNGSGAASFTQSDHGFLGGESYSIRVYGGVYDRRANQSTWVCPGTGVTIPFYPTLCSDCTTVLGSTVTLDTPRTSGVTMNQFTGNHPTPTGTNFGTYWYARVDESVTAADVQVVGACCSIPGWPCGTVATASRTVRLDYYLYCTGYGRYTLIYTASIIATTCSGTGREYFLPILTGFCAIFYCGPTQAIRDFIDYDQVCCECTDATSLTFTLGRPVGDLPYTDEAFTVTF